MKLPSVEQAFVSEAKIREYLLSESHPKGRDKAKFFLRFGFSPEEWEVFKEAILAHANQYEVTEIVPIDYGTNYVIEGELQCPDGRTPQVRSVWCIDHDRTIPRLITAYPID